MFIRIRRNGMTIYCGDYLEWYRHHSPDTRMIDLVCRAFWSDDEVHSGLEFPEALWSVWFTPWSECFNPCCTRCDE